MVIKLALGFLCCFVCTWIYGDIIAAYLWTFLGGIIIMAFIDIFFFD
jgi:hypothetical protein